MATAPVSTIVKLLGMPVFEIALNPVIVDVLLTRYAPLAAVLKFSGALLNVRFAVPFPAAYDNVAFANDAWLLIARIVGVAIAVLTNTARSKPI